MVKELSSNEQIRMTVQEAGTLYDGYFIFFTNSEDAANDSNDIYAVPRVISLKPSEFAQSGLYEKYNDEDKYGISFACPFYMASENVPPILSF